MACHWDTACIYVGLNCEVCSLLHLSTAFSFPSNSSADLGCNKGSHINKTFRMKPCLPSNLTWPQGFLPLQSGWANYARKVEADQHGVAHGVRMASRSFEGNWENSTPFKQIASENPANCPVPLIPLKQATSGRAVDIVRRFKCIGIYIQ